MNKQFIFQQQQPPPGDFAAAATVIFIIIGVALVIGLLIFIFYLLSLSKALSLVRQRNREMEPGLVWLNLIPCLNIVWIFITVVRIAASLRREYRSRGIRRRDSDFGQSIGIAFAALQIAGIIPYVGVVCSIAGFICWIIHWVQIAGFNAKLENSRSRRYDDDEDDGDDDDYERDDYRDRSRDRDSYKDRFRNRDRDDDRYRE